LAIFSPQTSLPPLPKVQADYEFTEIIVAEEHVDAIRLLTGPFANVIFYYGHVKVVPEGETHRLAYQYTIWDTAGLLKSDLVNSKDFTTHLGDILAAIILDESQEGEYVSTRKHDSEEPDLQ